MMQQNQLQETNMLYNNNNTYRQTTQVQPQNGDLIDQKDKQIPSVHHRQSQMKQKIAFVVLISLVVYILQVYIYQNNKEVETTGRLISTKLPKILWIYTHFEWDAEGAMTEITINYFNHTATSLGYEVKIVNSWTAYDWLSPETIADISKTIQNTKIDQTVSSLLKLALLIEHGGIMIANTEVIFVKDNFLWLEAMFDKYGSSKGYAIDPDIAEVYVPSIPYDWDSKYYFSEYLFAALPKSQFLIESYELLKQVITTGKIPNSDIFGFIEHNSHVNIDFIPSSIASVMTSLVYDYSKVSGSQDYHQYYKIQQKDKSNFQDQRRYSKFLNERVLNLDKSKLQNIDFVINHHKTCIRYLDSILFQQPVKLIKNSLLQKLFTAPENYRILLKPVSPRDSQLCLIGIDDLNTDDQIQQMITMVEKQSYKQWKLVVFAKDKTILSVTHNQVDVRASSKNQIRNIQIAVTQHCKHTSYAVLLRAGDSFSSPEFLSKVAETAKRRQVAGASVSLKINDKIYNFQEHNFEFLRERDYIVSYPNVEKTQAILNHMRIFSVSLFKYISQTQWRDVYGVYFENRQLVLGNLLAILLRRGKTQDPNFRYEYNFIKRKYADIFHFPLIGIKIDESFWIQTKQYQKMNMTLPIRIKHRYDIEGIADNLIQSVDVHQPYRKILVFNQGEEYIGIDKKTGPQLIPKLIHSVWIGGQMPKTRRYFIDKIQRMHPDYTMMIWGEQNITRENFPVAYDAIHNLLRYQKSGQSNYKKYATITDILRHEITYKNGGFWRDAGFNLFRPVLDMFLHYKLVIGAQWTQQNRWNMAMCFYGNEPLSEHMLRVSNYRNVNRMRYYDYKALQIAGPVDFRQVMEGQQEYDPNILFMNIEYFYPTQQYHLYPDACVKSKNELREGEPFVFEEKGYVMLTPECEKYYKYAFGQDHHAFGKSWMVPVRT